MITQPSPSNRPANQAASSFFISNGIAPRGEEKDGENPAHLTEQYFFFLIGPHAPPTAKDSPHAGHVFSQILVALFSAPNVIVHSASCPASLRAVLRCYDSSAGCR